MSSDHEGMVRAFRLRYNKNPNGQMRLEELWIQDCSLIAWTNPVQEWWPLEVVKVGFDPTDFSKPVVENVG